MVSRPRLWKAFGKGSKLFYNSPAGRRQFDARTGARVVSQEEGDCSLNGTACLADGLGVGVGLFLSLGFTLVLHAETPSSGLEIMQKVLQRAKWTAEKNPQADYTFNQLSRREKLDGNGSVKEKDEKLFEVFYIEGLMYRRLVKRNGQPLSAEEVTREQQRERDFRQQLPERKRRKAQGPQPDEVALNEELISRYSFDLVGQETINGRPCYEVTYRPRSDDLPIRHRIDRLLNKVAGKVWVDTQDYEIAKLEIHLAGKATMWAGLIASVRKLEGEFEQTRTDEGVWLPLRIEGSLDARVFVTNYRLTQNDRWSDFRKVGNLNSGNEAKQRKRD